MLPFLLNQLGSVVYVATLAGSDISLAQPICNSLATLFTAVTSRVLGEQALNRCMQISCFIVCLFVACSHLCLPNCLQII